MWWVLVDDYCLRHPRSLKGVVGGLGGHQSWGVGLRKTPETVAVDSDRSTPARTSWPLSPQLSGSGERQWKNQ